ncbi:MAG: helix-turn-helix domain-containing protein [Clostridiales bacterium]|nr:helix-turn-helix domain-containing protein [Clostridiales bacterium]
MGIHYYDLQTASLIQEKHSMSLVECGRRMNRSVSSVKNSIAAVNAYLPPEKQILINDYHAVFQMTYTEYLEFIRSLTLDDYYSSQSERLDIIAVYAFFNETLNMTHLYDTLRISLSTKKKDSRALSEWLADRNLSTEVVPRAGIRIVGDEILYRICVSNILYQYVEVDRDFNLTFRHANNPWQLLIVRYYLVKADAQLERTRAALTRLIDSNHCRISYASVKFLYIYLSCAYFRLDAGHALTTVKTLPVSLHDYQLSENPPENEFVNQLISSLDFISQVLPPFNETLSSLSTRMIQEVQNQIITRILDDHCIYEEVYSFLHKCIIRNHYHFSFYDNKLEETREYYHNLYDVLKTAVKPFEEFYGLPLSHFQISSLTLIFRKFITKNKLAGRNQKRLVIVTNSSMEKVGFFMEKLKLRADVLLKEVIHINELYLLEQIDYDHLIVFSNRIATMLSDLGYDCIKLHFYLGEEDYQLLFRHGFSTSRRKLKASSFVAEISGVSSNHMTRYLLEHYEDFFME